MQLVRNPAKMIEMSGPIIKEGFKLKGTAYHKRIKGVCEISMLGPALAWKNSRRSDPLRRLRKKLNENKERLTELEKMVAEDVNQIVREVLE